MPEQNRSRSNRGLALLTVGWTGALVVSGWNPFDRATWWMEIAPALIVLPVLWATRRRFQPTNLALALIFVHGLVLIVGGAYTYARVPIGIDVESWLGLSRNPYDRFGHLMQGFVPAIVLRELLIKLGGMPPGRLLTTLVLACCLAVSASYEVIEFAATMALGQGANEFLGAQGDAWDTQWDMLTCLIGAGFAVVLLSRFHDRRLGQQFALRSAE